MNLFDRRPLIWLIGLMLGLSLSPLTSDAATHEVRVGLAQGVTVLTLTGSEPFTIRPSSGSPYQVSGSVTVKRQAEGFLVNNRLVKAGQVSIADQPGITFQIRIAGNTTGTAGAERAWTVRGLLDLVGIGPGFTVVSRVPLEEYVGGVVSGEVSSGWPLESLKAQAVAARTYVMYKKMENRAQPFDVLASVQDQVYTGHAVQPESIQRAIQATKGKVLTFDQRPIFAAYSSTAAGPTEDALYVWALDLPYLKGVDCPFDEQSPRYEWQSTFTLEDLERQLRKEGYPVGAVATLTPYTFTPSGRVDRVRILHSQGEVILRGQDLRRIVGYSKIFSTQFTIHKLGAEVVVGGRGAGHAVGLCQWGMREMAQLGYDYHSILQYYYPGTTLLPLDRVTLASD